MKNLSLLHQSLRALRFIVLAGLPVACTLDDRFVNVPEDGGAGGPGDDGRSGGASSGGEENSGVGGSDENPGSGGRSSGGSASSTGGEPPSGGGTDPGTGGSQNPSGGASFNGGGTSSGGDTAAGGGTNSGGDTAVGGGTTSGGADSGGGAGVGGAAQFNGYHKSGSFKGWVYTMLETPPLSPPSTISPQGFEDLATDGPYCVSGTQRGSFDFAGIAALGFYIYQEPDGSPVSRGPVGAGIYLRLSKVGPQPSAVSPRQRLYVHLSNGEFDTGWCAIVDEDFDGTIPWEDFNTECWDNLGSWYDSAKLIDRVLIHPPVGGEGEDVVFDYCVDDISTP